MYETEAKFRSAVIRYLKKHRPDIMLLSFPVTTRSGIPDLLLIIPQSNRKARYVWVELKRSKGYKVEKLQLHFKNEIEVRGGEAYIINSMRAIEQILNNHFLVDEVK